MKKNIENIKELKEKKYGKVILFFGFYLLFFLFLAIFARVGRRNSTLSSDYERGSTDKGMILENLENSNYKYVYTITLDDIKYTCSGEKYGNLELFEFNNQKYYYDGVNYYLYGTLNNIDYPLGYREFLDFKKVINLSKLGYLESSTNYEDGKVNYNYLVSSNTINKEFNFNETDFDEIPNNLIIGTDKDKNINHIDFKLDSYCLLNNLCNKNLRVELSYSDFGKVEKIVNSIN